MTQRRRSRIAALAAVVTACSLALSLWIVVRVREAAASRAVSSVLLQPGRTWAKPGSGPHARSAMLSVATSLAACEGRIARQAHRLPTVAIVGASYTAGIGPGNPEDAWAVKLAQLLHWNAVIYGVPGAGYVSPSASGRGPMARMLGEENLRRIHPALTIVQAGHDDLGVPARLEMRRVGAAVDQIRAAAPGARVALLTTFAVTPEGSPALRQTDQEIVTAGTMADPGVIIMDPLAGHWAFPRAGGGLHPTAAGEVWIAHTVAAILSAHGVRPASATPVAPVICDVSIGAGKPVSATT